MDETIEKKSIGSFPKPTTDSMFKEMMKQFSEDKGNLFSSFLEDMMCLEKGTIKKISFVGNELQSEYSEGKVSRLDLLLEIDNELVDVEMQVAKDGDYKDRSLYYWSKIFSNQLKSGEDYKELKKTVCINIVDFDMFDCQEYQSVFRIKEDIRNEIYTDKFEIRFYELNKLGDRLDENNRQSLWLKLFCVKSEEDLDMLAKTNVKEIQDAVIIVKKLTRSEEMRDRARREEEGQHDLTMRLNYAHDKGVTEEHERRKAERERAIAFMRVNNIPEDKIQSYLDSIQDDDKE